MCLFKDKEFHPHNRPLVADRDIICYKKLDQIKENVYITPCTYDQVPIECIQDKVPFKAKILHKFKFIWKHVFGFSPSVEDGFIHSFQTDNGFRGGYVTFKCIIPKGTEYFIGSDNHIASKEIIFLEKLG